VPNPATTGGAAAELHGLLLRAARFEVGRQRGSLPAGELEEIARDAADAALARLRPQLRTVVVKLVRLSLWPAALAAGGATAALIVDADIADSPALTASFGLTVGSPGG
jgi:hypothetical protein